MPHTSSTTPPASPLISFIVPTYNMPATYLTECLDSIMRLPIESAGREIILVDDGSDIPAIDGIPQYKDEIVCLRQKNQGLSAARNAGLNIATGEYVQFVDSDDCLILSAYKKIIDAAKQIHVDIIYFRSSYSMMSVERTYPLSAPTDGATLLLTQSLRAAAWGYLFKRNILGTVRFSIGLLHEDEEFTPLLFLNAHRIVCTDIPAYYYRQRTGSIVNDLAIQHLTRRFNDFETIIIRLKDYAEGLTGRHKAALQRRIAQQTIEYLYNIARLAKSNQLMGTTIGRLRQKGLYPVPNLHLDLRYLVLRTAFNNKLGRMLAIKLIPIIKP